MAERQTSPTTQCEVMATFLPTPITDTPTPLPMGWFPLSAVAAGEFIIVVCYREV